MSALQWTDLVARIRIQIRDNGETKVFPDITDLADPSNGVNTSPELTQMAQDSVAKFSRWRPLRKRFTLTLVPGQTTYPLPSDWLLRDAKSFEKALNPGHLERDGLDYFVPRYVVVGGSVQDIRVQHLTFSWYNDAQEVVVSTDPQVSSTLTFDYFAHHTPSTIPAQWVDAALLPACERALRAVATDQAVKLQKYRVGRFAIEVDNSKIVDHLHALADGYREEFRRQVIAKPLLVAS